MQPLWPACPLSLPSRSTRELGRLNKATRRPFFAGGRRVRAEEGNPIRDPMGLSPPSLSPADHLVFPFDTCCRTVGPLRSQTVASRKNKAKKKKIMNSKTKCLMLVFLEDFQKIVIETFNNPPSLTFYKGLVSRRLFSKSSYKVKLLE